MEHQKFEARAAEYHNGVQEILKLGYDSVDYIHHNPAFNGKENMARILSLYEIYKKVIDLSGHVAEVGVWKGATLLLFAKLISLFETYSYTQVHGFDWFQGMDPDSNYDRNTKPGSYQSDYDTLLKLVQIQKLDNICKIHRMDVTKDLGNFFEIYPSLRFKLVFLDAGTYEFVKSCIQQFWPRLQKGGIMFFDQYNECRATGETIAATEMLPADVQVQTIRWTKQPSAFVVK